MARRAIKSFRKATGWEGEVKGHRMTSGQQRILFDLAFAAPGAAAVVVCDARTPFGGWVVGAQTEAELYPELVIEACTAVIATAPGDVPCSAVTADGGRYTRAIRDRQRKRVEGALRELLAAPAAGQRVVDFGESHSTPGLQIADVVGSAVYRHLLLPGTRAEAPMTTGSELLGPWLTVRHTELKAIRPAWLGSPPY